MDRNIWLLVNKQQQVKHFDFGFKLPNSNIENKYEKRNTEGRRNRG
jgi:hypothetical protein